MSISRRKAPNLVFNLPNEHSIVIRADEVLQGCEGAINIFDDIIVHGATESEHNQRLHQLLQRIREKRLTLNKGKCKFNM